MKRAGLWGTAFAALALSGCGGGSGGGSTSGGGGTVVTPTPTPTTSAPTPTPTAVGSYPTYDSLSGVVRLMAANSGFIYWSTFPFPVGVNPFGEGVGFEYDVSARSYASLNGPISRSFLASELDPAPPEGTVHYLKADGSYLWIRQPNLAHPFQYVRFIDYRNVTDPGDPRVVEVTGIPTLTADLPTSGTYRYDLDAALWGDAYVIAGPSTTHYSISHSLFSVVVNYAARTVTAHVDVMGTPDGGGADVPLGTLDLATDFDGNVVSRSLTGSISTIDRFAADGIAFGPHVEEVGAVFMLTAISTGATPQSLYVVALGAAKR